MNTQHIDQFPLLLAKVKPGDKVIDIIYGAGEIFEASEESVLVCFNSGRSELFFRDGRQCHKFACQPTLFPLLSNGLTPGGSLAVLRMLFDQKGLQSLAAEYEVSLTDAEACALLAKMSDALVAQVDSWVHGEIIKSVTALSATRLQQS